jgi:hypothetical protein
MKKLILTIMMLASIQTYAGQDGGGGGVIKRDGMYLTFGSAGMKVKLSAPQGLQQIPSLDLLISVLDSTQGGAPDSLQGKLIDAALPSDVRRYFRIDSSQLDSNVYANLIAEYAKLLNGQIDPSNLDLAAITINRDTYLLPPFFQLKSAEQAAILFHESIWIVKPNVQYDELVNAEMVMQAHIEKYGTRVVYDPDLITMISSIMGYKLLPLLLAIKEDFKNDLFNKYGFPYSHIYTKNPNYPDWGPEKFYSAEKYYLLTTKLFLNSSKNEAEYLMNIRRDMKQYPEFKFLKILYSLRTKINMYTESYSLREDPVKILKIFAIANTNDLKLDYSDCIEQAAFMPGRDPGLASYNQNETVFKVCLDRD